MSRCFPFPPPGYEKKTRADNLDLLKKEKQGEKKHKKEKKDREKREGKEKKEKDKSDEKHREKKDKKEKNRDKKKDRDKDKEKEKSSILDEKRLPGQSEGHNAEKVSKEKKYPGQSEDNNGEKVSNDKRLSARSEGLNGERVSNEKRLPLLFEVHSEEKFIRKEDKQRNNLSNDRISEGQSVGYNEKVSKSMPLAEGKPDSKFVQELDGRVREEGRGTGNHYVGSDQKRDEGMLKSVAKATGNGAGGNDKKKHKKDDGRRIDGHETRDDRRFSWNSMVENVVEMAQTRVEGIARPLETNAERKIEGNEKAKEKGSDDKRRDKRKDRDKEKKSHGKDKDRDKERKKEEKAKEKKENKTAAQDQLKESVKNDVIGTPEVKVPNLFKDTNNNAATEGNPRKRKDSETNGVLHANENRPNKLPRPTSSSHSLKNGRILESCQTLNPFNSDRQASSTNLKVENKDQGVNGIVEAQPFPVSSTKPSLATLQADQIAEAPRIPPHPDSVYLSQILSVPTIEELSDFDEQNWLFSSRNSISKNSKVESFRDDNTPQVWSEGRRIESADVYALPYVIPY